MKKIFKNVISLALLTSLVLTTACGSTDSQNTDEPQTNSETREIIVGATSVPHAEILNFVKEDLLEQGIDLTVKEFSDYNLINQATVEGSLDANFFQHGPFLESFNENSDDKLVSVGPVHIEPLGIYSESLTSIDELKEGDKVAIPNDPTNEARALVLLEDNGLIKVNDRESTTLTPLDIIDNPLNLEFVELDAAQLPRTLSEVAVSVINTNYALEAGFNPSNDALAIEDGTTSPYANVLVVKEGNENDEAIIALYDALTSEETRTFIEQTYEGAIIPAF